MDFRLSSEKIGNPLLVDLLRKISKCFAEINQTYYVIGATARDLIVHQLVGIASSRRTRDLDLAIAIPDWSAFDDITEALLASSVQAPLHGVYKPACTNFAPRAYLSEWKNVTCNVKGNR